jgi:HPt (histidine-containing phosphotransfer) domain-containing protein
MEQREKLLRGKAASAQIKASEVEKFFVWDAENAINTLEHLIINIQGITEKGMQLYNTSVHGTKSALANIGEKELASNAYRLEQAGKDRNFKILSAETPVLIDALKSLVTKLKPVLENNDLVISGSDLGYLRDKLLEIKAACDTYDKNTAKSALNDLRQKEWSNNIEAVLDDIAVDLLHSDFDKAANTAENIATNLAL